MKPPAIHRSAAGSQRGKKINVLTPGRILSSSVGMNLVFGLMLVVPLLWLLFGSEYSTSDLSSPEDIPDPRSLKLKNLPYGNFLMYFSMLCSEKTKFREDGVSSPGSPSEIERPRTSHGL